MEGDVADQSNGSLVTYALATLLLALVIKIIVESVSMWTRRRQDLKRLQNFPTVGFGQDGVSCTFDHPHLRAQGRRSEIFQGLYTYFVGPYVALEISHPSPLSKILGTAEPKAELSYKIVSPWIGDGLLLSTGAKWARNRRLLTPAFHFEVLKPYVNVFSTSVNIMISKWKKMLETTDTIEMFDSVSLMTLDSLLKCIYRQSSNIQEEGKENTYIKHVYKLSELAIRRIQCPIYLIDWIYNISPLAFQFRKSCQVVHAYSRGIIQERREEKKKEKEQGIEKKKKYIDFLDILLDARDDEGKGLTDTEIQHEVDTFMFEGHDTTASGAFVGIAIYGAHHNASVWEDPDTYDPERFSPENSKGRSPHAFVPFSAGPRNCIGKHFAMNEMRTVMALCLKHFEFSCDESYSPQMSPDLILRTKGGMWIQVKQID